MSFFICRPVVITDVVSSWAAMNWSGEFFYENYGNERVTMKTVNVSRLYSIVWMKKRNRFWAGIVISRKQHCMLTSKEYMKKVLLRWGLLVESNTKCRISILFNLGECICGTHNFQGWNTSAFQLRKMIR